MTKGLYDLTRQDFLTGGIAMDTATIKWMLVKSGYVVNLGTHHFISDVGAANIIQRSSALTGKTVTNGVFGAADTTLLAVPNALSVASLILVKDTGVDGTSPLILYTDEATGLPLATNGGDITVQEATGVEKIFKL